MGPMGNYMTLLQLARGRGMGGYGGGAGRYGGFGPSGGNMYGAAGQMAGMYGASRPFDPSFPGQGNPQYGAPPQQGSFMRPIGAEGMLGAASAMQGAGGAPQASGMRPISAEGMPGAADANMQALQAAYGQMGAMQGNPYMNTAYNPMGLRGRRRFY